MDDRAAIFSTSRSDQTLSDVVGRERVIAGADCGFGAIARLPTVHVSIVWRKLQSIVEGIHFAGRELWHHNIVPGRKSALSTSE